MQHLPFWVVKFWFMNFILETNRFLSKCIKMTPLQLLKVFNRTLIAMFISVSNFLFALNITAVLSLFSFTFKSSPQSTFNCLNLQFPAAELRSRHSVRDDTQTKQAAPPPLRGHRDQPRPHWAQVRCPGPQHWGAVVHPEHPGENCNFFAKNFQEYDVWQIPPNINLAIHVMPIVNDNHHSGHWDLPNNRNIKD